MRYRTLRRLLWAGIALCVLALALGLTERLLGRQPGVTAENAARVRRGMTLPEVEALMGMPGKREEIPVISYAFFGREGVASIIFDERGRAFGAPCVYFRSTAPPRPGPLGRLREWLGW
jgi:hypothetical protein